MRAAEMELEMQQLSQRIFLSGGMHVDVSAAARRRAEREKAVQEAKDTLAEIDAIGVQVKDLEQGLLDFPCHDGGQDGAVVLEAGRGGDCATGTPRRRALPERKPLDARFGKTERLN